MNSITINGKTITSSKSIVITNGKVIIDGNDATPMDKTINISVQGDVENLHVDVCSKIQITGNAKTVHSTSADIEISGSVNGNVGSTSGDISCGNVTGNIQTVSGDVKCEEVKGSVSTLSGDIKNKK